MAKNEEKTEELENDSGGIVPRNIAAEMRESYLDYAMSVITSRALPDVRDGLKPVHRRILYTMHRMGLTASARSRKSAAVVGDVLGKFHPHGDTAVYDAMVKMAQEFAMRYPLVLGQGNFGSIDGDSAAAMRYCVTGDVRVVTEQGLLAMGEIPHEGDDHADVSVLSLGRQVHKADRWFASGEHPTIRVTTSRGFSLRGSRNHPIAVWAKHPLTGAPQLQWKLLSRLSRGDVAVIDRTDDALWPVREPALTEAVSIADAALRPRMERKVLPKRMTPDLAFILGALLAEGTLHEHELEFCNSDGEYLETFRAAFANVFPDTRLHEFERKPNSYGTLPYRTFEIHSRHVVAFFAALGLRPARSPARTVPDIMFRSGKESVAAFIRSFMEGDGSISYSGKMNELSLISASGQLASEFQLLFLRFGIAATKRFDAHRSMHKLYIRGKGEYERFQSAIGFVSSRKKAKLSACIKRLSKDWSQSDVVPYLAGYVRAHVREALPWSAREFVQKHNFDRYAPLASNVDRLTLALEPATATWVETAAKRLLENRYLFDPVASVEDAGMAPVYSVRVDSSCHSYVANGFINHNTEAKMTKLSSELLGDIDKATVNWRPNYDGTQKEPVVLPAAVPNILLNGTLGIAVGMATNIPPHNLRELASAVSHLIDTPDATVEDLMQFVQGPDFPTGAIVFNKKDLLHAYTTGRGGVVARGVAEVVEGKKAKTAKGGSPDAPGASRGDYQIIITSIPYRVNKADLIVRIADLVREKKIEGIRGLRDESTSDIRIVVDLKQGAHPQKVLNYLYKHTALEDAFHFNMVVLVDGVPQTLSLKSMLAEFIKHRREVVKRRTEFDLGKAKDREHILLGLKKALDHIDEIIKLIKASNDVAEAHANLIKKFKFSDPQASAILEMKLSRLANLERKKIEDELKEVQAQIEELETLLKSDKKMLALIKTELGAVAEKYGDDRRTKVVKGAAGIISEEDMVADMEQVVTLSKGGYIKRTDPAEYRKQKRGGVGVIDLETKEEDFVTTFLTTSTHADLLFFTDLGKAYQIKMYELPEGKRSTKGKAIVNYLSTTPEEQISSILPMRKNQKAGENYLFMITKQGTAKKVDATAFHDVRRSGLIAIKLKKGDELIKALLVEQGDEIILATAKGQSVRFKESDIRAMGRTAGGVRGMKLGSGDTIVGADVLPKGSKGLEILVVSRNGYGKTTEAGEYKTQKRGGSGIKVMKSTPKTGPVIAVKVISKEEGVGEDEIVVISKKGQVIRTELKQIPSLSRSTQGVRVMKLRDGDAIASFVCL